MVVLQILLLIAVLIIGESFISLRRINRNKRYPLMSSTASPPFNSKFLLLGSGSSTRRAILSEAGFEFSILKADIDERAIGDRSDGSMENARELVVELGMRKAAAILSQLPAEVRGNILLTADQVVVCNNQILEKPSDVVEAKSFIAMYKSLPCCTVGSIVLTDIRTGKQVTGVECATIFFNEIPEEVVNELLEEGDIMHCAGALMIEHQLVQPYIREIRGRIDSVMGLSIKLLEQLLTELHGK